MPRLLAALVAILLIGIAACSNSVPGSPVIAKVDGDDIFLDQFRETAAYMGLGSDPSKMGPEVRQSVLESLVRQHLVLSRAHKLGIKLDSEELEYELNSLRQGASEEAFQNAITAQGLDFGQWLDSLARELLVRKTLDLVLAPKSEVTPAEVSQYYQSHVADYQRPAQVLINHVVVPTKDLAVKIRQQVDQGLSLIQAAAQEGITLDVQGQPSWVEQGQLPPEVEKEIFELEPGKWGGPWPSAYGFHVVNMVSKKPAGKIPLGEAAGGIQRRLTSAKMERMSEEWINQLRGQVTVWVDPDFAKGK